MGPLTPMADAAPDGRFGQWVSPPLSFVNAHNYCAPIREAGTATSSALMKQGVAKATDGKSGAGDKRCNYPG